MNFFLDALASQFHQSPKYLSSFSAQPILLVLPIDIQYLSSMLPARVCSLGRGLVFRGPTTRVATSVFLSGRITVPHRSFVSASRHLQEAFQSSANSSANSTAPASQASIPEEQRRKNARSVKVFRVPRRVERSKIEAIFTDAGFQVSVLVPYHISSTDAPAC